MPIISDLEAFLAAYDRMRDLQRRHFAGERGLVGQAKAAEARCDLLRARLREHNRPPVQPDLFLVAAGQGIEDDDSGPWWAR